MSKSVDTLVKVWYSKFGVRFLDKKKIVKFDFEYSDKEYSVNIWRKEQMWCHVTLDGVEEMVAKTHN